MGTREMGHLSRKTRLAVQRICSSRKYTGRSRDMVVNSLLKQSEGPVGPKVIAKAVTNGDKRASSAPFQPSLKRVRVNEHHSSNLEALESAVSQRILKRENAEEQSFDKDSSPMPIQIIADGGEASEKPGVLHSEPIAPPDILAKPPTPSRSLPVTPPNAPLTGGETGDGRQFQVKENLSKLDGINLDSATVASSPITQCQEGGGLPACDGVLPTVESLKGIVNIDRSPVKSIHEEVDDPDPLKLKPVIQVSERSVGSPGPAAPDYFHGLWNLGNTCYMNAVIQLLYHLRCFAADMQRLESMELSLTDGVYGALLQVFQQLRNANVNFTVSPLRLKISCEKHIPDFFGSVQQDAHEFLCNVLDRIQEETFSCVKEHTGVPSFVTTPERLCPTTRNFSSLVRNTLSCEECGNSVHVYQSCRHFSLPLPEDKRDPAEDCPDIESLLDLYFQMEIVPRKCEKCGVAEMRSNTKILRLPQVLVLHINRFEIDRHLMCSKVSVPVKYGDHLNLGKWCVEEVNGPLKNASGNQGDAQGRRQDLTGCAEILPKNGVCEERPLATEQVGTSGQEVKDFAAKNYEVGFEHYKLHGVVSHVGALASCGHYMVDIHDSLTDKWIRCDDILVKEVRPEAVFCKEKAAEAYVLLYVLCR